MEKKIEYLELMENITRKNKLTKADVDALSGKINKEAFASLSKQWSLLSK